MNIPGVPNGISDVDEKSRPKGSMFAGGRYPVVGPRGADGKPSVSYGQQDGATPGLPVFASGQWRDRANNIVGTPPPVGGGSMSGYADKGFWHPAPNGDKIDPGMTRPPAGLAGARGAGELPQGAEGEAAGVSGGLDFTHTIAHTDEAGRAHKLVIKGQTHPNGISAVAPGPSWDEFYRGVVQQGGRNSYGGRNAGRAVDAADHTQAVQQQAQAQQAAAVAAGAPPQLGTTTDQYGNTIYYFNDHKGAGHAGHVAPPALAMGKPGETVLDRNGKILQSLPGAPAKPMATDKPVFDPNIDRWLPGFSRRCP